MTMYSKRSALIAAGVFGAVIVVAAAYIVWDLRFAVAPDEVAPLPEESTVLLVRNMDDAAWQRVIPVLDLPSVPSPLPRDAALLSLPSGATEWIALTPGSRAVEGVSQEAAALLATVERPLQRTALVGGEPTTEPLLVATQAALDLGDAVDTRTVLRLQPGGSLTLSWEGPHAPRGGAQTLVSDAARGTLRVFVRAPGANAALAGTVLPVGIATVAKTLALTAVTDLAGHAVSPLYDLLPRADRAVTFERTASGGTLIYGIGETQADDALITALHAGSDENGAQRITAPTKEGFTVDVLRPGTAPQPAERRTGDGWTIDTSTRNGRPFATAVRGKELLIANDVALIDAAIAHIAPVDNATVAQGILPDRTLSPLAIGLLPDLKLQKLLSILERPQGADAGWLLQEQGGRWILTVTPH